MLFITSDIKVLATLTNVEGESLTISVQFRTAKRGMFKEEMERQILKTMNSNGIVKKIIKVRVHQAFSLIKGEKNMKKIGLILIATLLICVGAFVCISVFIWHNTFTSVLFAAGIFIWLWILEAEQNN